MAACVSNGTTLLGLMVKGVPDVAATWGLSRSEEKIDTPLPMATGNHRKRTLSA